jgi:nucleoid-associated protein YejK
MLQIENLIIHNIIKKQHDTTIIKKFRPSEINVTDKHIVFFQKILNIYYRKSNPAYGVFDNDKTSYPYQTLVDDFLETKTTFKNFTEYSMNLFVSKMKTNATGGFYLASYFTSNSNKFLAIIMLNNTTNYDIDESNLDIVEKMTLDIDKIDVANIINLTKREQKTNTYLSFTKGRKEISGYFIEFIGCSKLTDSKHFSNNLKLGINDYLLHEGVSNEEKVRIKMAAYSILYQRTKEKKDIDIQEFCNSLFPENPDKLKDFLSVEDREITSNFKCEMSVFKDYQIIHFESSKVKFQFDRDLLDDINIVYNRDEKSLKFKNLDQSVINQIENIDDNNS